MGLFFMNNAHSRSVEGRAVGRLMDHDPDEMGISLDMLVLSFQGGANTPQRRAASMRAMAHFWIVAHWTRAV